MLKERVGTKLGGEIGEFIEMEKEEDGMAIGQFLRVKVRMNIKSL